MELRRFFVDASNCIGDKIIITGDEFLHLKNVLRMKLGFKLIVCLNDGNEKFCEIVEIQNDSAIVKVEKTVRKDTKKNYITLFPAVLKNNKLDYVIQKAVELGVDEIIPFTSQNCNETKFNEERANRIALESAKQCGSATLTVVKPMINFDNVISKFEEFDNIIMPYEDETQKSFQNSNFIGHKHAVIIGSEGGFTKEEVDLAKNHNAQIVSLGSRILRADTASIVSVALLMNELGELAR
ncbi:MAG TPA: RsmE family RNA methyltransferase [Clostridia bacterium]|nr:RsmE family RNA methyltransferase [Clostridia bacterium]